MRITLNGEHATLPEGARLIDALATLGLTAREAGVAVAVSGRVVRRADWPERRLHEGDRVEVVTASQGG